MAENADTIKATYKPPSEEEILKMMRNTDNGVPNRLKTKRDRLQTQIVEAEKNNDIDRILMLQAELDNTTKPKDWVKNNYTIEDARLLRDRWLEASNKFEKLHGQPLPWSVHALSTDEFGRTISKRVFGQDVEHGIPVNQGGTGKIEELTLLPSIPNMGKGDSSWDEYASKNPEGWNNIINILYGEAKRY